LTHLGTTDADEMDMVRIDVVLVRGLSAVAGVASTVMALAVSGAMNLQERRTVPVRVARRSPSA